MIQRVEPKDVKNKSQGTCLALIQELVMSDGPHFRTITGQWMFCAFSSFPFWMGVSIALTLWLLHYSVLCWGNVCTHVYGRYLGALQIFSWRGTAPEGLIHTRTWFRWWDPRLWADRVSWGPWRGVSIVCTTEACESFMTRRYLVVD